MPIKSDDEHTSVSVTHESEWRLGVYRGGYVVLENLEEGEPRHMTDVPPEKILLLWQFRAAGDLRRAGTRAVEDLDIDPGRSSDSASYIG